jgi:hypothetical protein
MRRIPFKATPMTSIHLSTRAIGVAVARVPSIWGGSRNAQP